MHLLRLRQLFKSPLSHWEDVIVKVTPRAEGEIIERMLWIRRHVSEALVTPSYCRVITETQILNLVLIKIESQGGDGYSHGGDATVESWI